MNNPYINRYTITIAVAETNYLYEAYLKSHSRFYETNNTKRFGDSYISAVQTGGKHLILYHIQTLGEAAYEKMLHKLQKYTGNIKDLEAFLQKIPSDDITIKEYFTKELSGIPTEDLAESFQQTQYFEKLLHQRAVPLHYRLHRYPLHEDSNRTLLRDKVISRIDTLLHMQYTLNGYHYFRHHPDQFAKVSGEEARKLYQTFEKYKIDIAQSMQQENLPLDTITADPVTLPERDKACGGIRIKEIKPENIHFNIDTKALKPDGKSNIRFDLSTTLDIQNHGKLTRTKTKLTVSINKLLHETRTKTKILFDTYIDFPSLRFQNIQNNYGSIAFALPFDKYTQEKTIQGSGIIQHARCGYDLSSTGMMKVYCKDITYKKIKIELINELDKKKVKEKS